VSQAIAARSLIALDTAEQPLQIATDVVARCTRLHPRPACQRRLVAGGHAHQALQANQLASRRAHLQRYSPANRLLTCVRFRRQSAFW